MKKSFKVAGWVGAALGATIIFGVDIALAQGTGEWSGAIVEPGKGLVDAVIEWGQALSPIIVVGAFIGLRNANGDFAATFFWLIIVLAALMFASQIPEWIGGGSAV